MATKTVVVPDGTPFRVAKDFTFSAMMDDGAPATPGHPHVEHWTDAGKQTGHIGQYVITRRKPTSQP